MTHKHLCIEGCYRCLVLLILESEACLLEDSNLLISLSGAPFLPSVPAALLKDDAVGRL